MPFRFGDVWRRYSAIGNWRLPGEPAFAKSRAFELLLRDLRRYVLEEVAGRSFLIAGHRGAGKTSTVTHAVRQLRREIISDSVDPAGIPTGRRGRLQRPMMVKLVGEAILSAPPRQKEVEEALAEEASEDQEEESAGGKKKPAAGDPAGNALIHITIALYRALAAEAAEAFTVHALGPEPRKPAEAAERADRLELAAQLALELDGTPEPAMLRSYWDRIGRLERGILWPPEADDAIEQSAIRDQGMKEVIAITTAAQAFQVCSGAVTYKVGREQSDKNETKSSSGVDVKELVNRIGALGAGALAGSVVGVGSSSAAEGVGIGLLVWLASGLTLSWTSARERSSSRTLNYQFIQDRSVQTLDRDLPVVIDRIRQAGLAPVFVVDELDKLVEEKAGEKIAAIIHRLKHLVADYGFFCFLANRDYFDLIQRRVEDEAYPTEHTYFSERVLVLSRAEDLYDYLISLLENVPEEGPGALHAAVFALVVMYRSKLNFSDVAREVATLTGPNDELICTEEELQSAGRYRLAATIQIAIGRVLGAKDVKERMELDSGFAQLAIDALYHIPRAWESDTDECVDIRPRSLRDDLLKRMGADPAPRPKKEPGDDDAGFPGEKEDCAISASDLRELVRMVQELSRHLLDFNLLQEDLQRDAARADNPEDEYRLKRLADIVLTVRGQLLRECVPHRPGRYCFVLNELANPVVPAPGAPVAGGGPPPGGPASRPKSRTRKPRAGTRAAAPAVSVKQAQASAEPDQATPVPATPAPSGGPDRRLAEVAPLFEAIADLVVLFEVTLDDLVASELLPATVSQKMLDGCIADLAFETRNPEAVERTINAYLAFVRALDERGPDLAQALILLTRAKRDSSKNDSAQRILSRLARYFDSSSPRIVPLALWLQEPWVSLAGNADSIEEFETNYELFRWLQKQETEEIEEQEKKKGKEARRGKAVGLHWTQLELRDPGLWQHWRLPVRSYLLSGQSTSPAAILYSDAVTAAADLPPGTAFRLRLARMDAVDWSRVTLAAVPYADKPAPAPLWPLFAGLVALGFDSQLLRGLKDAALGGKSTTYAPIDPDETTLIDQLINRAIPAQPAILHVLPDQPNRRTLTVSSMQPVLAVGASEFPSYVEALNWLVDKGAIIGATRDIG